MGRQAALCSCMCSAIVSIVASGSHNWRNFNKVVSSLALYWSEISSPKSAGDSSRESPSNMIFYLPGMCAVTATFASKCIDNVVYTMLPRLASFEFNLSLDAHAKELMLSP